MSHVCPCCGNTSWTHWGEVKDYSVTAEMFNLEQCTGCSVIRTIIDSSQDLGKYYQSQEYISHTSSAKNLMQEIYLLARKYTLHRKQKFLTQLAGGKKSILDYGCGTGDLLAALRKSGWSAEGLEPDNSARLKAISKGTTVYTSLSEIPPTQTYQLITLWHVLEHVPEPADVLEQLKKRLAQNGRMIIAVPNPNSADAQHYQSFWAGLDVPRHLWHFPRKSMSHLADKIHMKLDQVHPLRLDSFYVSLLSEQYQGATGITRWINGLQNGLSSNMKANKTGEWSSLIYILQA